MNKLYWKRETIELNRETSIEPSYSPSLVETKFLLEMKV